MAEISESPLQTSEEKSPVTQMSEPHESDPDFDPKTMRKAKPGLKRLILSLSVLFSFILGFPILWKSIEIYRAPLPFRSIESFSAQIESNPLLFPCQFQAIFVGFDSKSFGADELESAIEKRMLELSSKSSQCGTCNDNYTVSVVVDSRSHCVETKNMKPSCSWKCGPINKFDSIGKLKDNDEEADELLQSMLGSCYDSGYGGKVYSVVVVNGDEEVRAVVGKYRHAWITGTISEEEAVSRIAEIFVKVFVNGGKEEGSIQGEFMPVGADGKIVLSFSLLNADPRDWVYDWNFHEVGEVLVHPVIEALQPIANVTVESQVLYYTPKSSLSFWDDRHGSHIFSTKDLPFFVNSNEWHLDTSAAAGGRSKILQFVVYIPSAKECPLQLILPNGERSETNGFISPMWGGVVVWNPKSCVKNSDTKDIVRNMISPQDLQKVFEVVLGQLRQLFGLKSTNLYVGLSGTSILLGSERGFTEWELDVLSRHHTCFNLQTCATTLGSLSRLVQSLPRMIIKDEIGKQVQRADISAICYAIANYIQKL
ncbi:GPI transamidase component PIG-S isoform X2 [Neltuma alba]|uniref:GPI transamidase component PIG-S-like isoform X2 n=1 Tax=Neltuma alba TaxID=207710 RepID=UPI0010A37EA3|nr:GPI transamidase component PIG-S-like isoform X2 [Prosopis alba]XP_028797137.1 GPI transamidase component PIG-S isoform X2 [Prosopis alba]